MSAIFEGILLYRTAVDKLGLDLKKYCESQMSGIQIACAFLDEHSSAIVRIDSRNAPFSEEFDKLGSKLSSTIGGTLVVRYDSRIGHRSSSYFEGGHLVAAFGEADEIFSPLNDDGFVTGARFRVVELDEDEEYETVENAIELGLGKFGGCSWENLHFFIYNQNYLL